MAALNAATLAISVILGITVFQETLSAGRGRLSPAIIGLVIAVLGVVLLSSSQSGRAEVPRT